MKKEVEATLHAVKHPVTSSQPRKSLLITLIALFVAAIGLHPFISNQADYKGPLAILDRGFDISLVAALAILTTVIGKRIGRLLALEFVNLAEEISFSLMLGTGCLGMLVLGLALLGMLRPLPVFVLVLLCLWL